MAVEDRCRDNQILSIELESTWNIAASYEGSAHGTIGRQDSCIMTASKDGNYLFIGCADGHTSAKYGRDGADIVLKILSDFLEEMFKDEATCEEDMVRFLISRSGKRKINELWKDAVLKKTNYDANNVSEVDALKDYGTTLNGVLVTPNYITTISVGDGSILLVNRNGEIENVSNDYGSGIDTNLTFSMCLLDTELIETNVFLRQNYTYIMAVTDGISKTYDLCSDFLPQMLEAVDEGGYKKLYDDLSEFLSGQAADEISDDYSVVFTCLKDINEFDGNIKFPKLRSSLLYATFPKEFSGMGKSNLGIRRILSDEELVDLAIEICEEISDRKIEGEHIVNPIDCYIKYDCDTHKCDISGIYHENDESSDNNSIYRLFAPESYIVENKEIHFVAGMVYKLVLAENIFGFATIGKYRDQFGMLECKNTDISNSILSQECINYLYLFYTKQLKDDEYWDSQTWLIKLLESKLQFH